MENCGLGDNSCFFSPFRPVKVYHKGLHIDCYDSRYDFNSLAVLVCSQVLLYMYLYYRYKMNVVMQINCFTWLIWLKLTAVKTCEMQNESIQVPLTATADMYTHKHIHIHVHTHVMHEPCWSCTKAAVILHLTSNCIIDKRHCRIGKMWQIKGSS